MCNIVNELKLNLEDSQNVPPPNISTKIIKPLFYNNDSIFHLDHSSFLLILQYSLQGIIKLTFITSTLHFEVLKYFHLDLQR